MFGWYSIVHTNFWGAKDTKPFYPPSLSKSGPFTVENHIALNASKYKISPDYRCLNKPWLKNSAQTIFQGSTPLVTQILTHVIVWIVLYCAHKLLGRKEIKPLYPPSLSKAGPLTVPRYFCWIVMLFLWDCYGIHNGFLWDFYDISMGCLLGSSGIPMICLCYFYGIPMGFWKDFHGGSLEILLDFKGMSIRFPLDSYGICMVLCMISQWDFYGISMGFKMDFYGIPMVFPWDSCGNPLAFLWDFHDMSMVFLWDYSRTAMESKMKSIENQLKVTWTQLKLDWNQLNYNLEVNWE